MSMLEVVNYSRLVAGDKGELQNLVHISATQGVFFLDFRGPRTEAALQNKLLITQAQRRFFAQDLERKLDYVTEQDDDGYEFYDEVHVQTLKLSRKRQIQGSLNLPANLRPVEVEISSLATFMDDKLRELSLLLCKSLDPPISTEIVQEPWNPGRSNLCLGLAAAPAGTPLVDRHVDSDLLTMTFYDEPFLEVQQPTTGEWKVVDIGENLPIVNIGTSFQRASENRLRAALHGVRQSEKEINLIMYDLHECQL